MNYGKKSFSVAVGGESYRDGWDRIFEKKEPEPVTPETCCQRYERETGANAGDCPDDHCYYCDATVDLVPFHGQQRCRLAQPCLDRGGAYRGR